MALIEKDFRVKKGIIVTEDATIGGNLTVTGSINADIVGNASTSSAWVTPRTITLSGDVNGSVTIDGSSDVTITTTSSADSIELGTDTTGNYTSSVLQGSGIIIDGVIGEGSEFTVSHADTSSVIDLTSSGRTYVTSLTFDTFGHVTGYSTGTETILGTDLTYLTAETSGTITTSTGTTDAIIPAATQTLAGLMTNLDKIKLDSIESNSQVNQNAFSNISVSGQITVSADSPSDTLTLIAGTNISITTDSVNDTITINADDTSVDWSEIQNKPDPVITVTLEGDITGTANTTLTDLTSGTITLSTTISSNSVELGTDTTGNYMSEVTQGDGIIVSHTPGEGSSATISHADTSSQESVDNTNGTVIQDIALDGFGHITSIGSVNLDSRYFTETESDSRFVLKSGDTMSGYLTLHSNPTNSLHAVTKQYVDEVAEGLETKPSVEIATIGNLDATYSNGVDGVGATLTANSNGAFPEIDGITLTSITPGENGVLVKNEPNSAHNGRYNLTQVGDANNPWILTRCGLCDESNEIPGSYTFVKQGTSYKGTGWVQIVTNPSTFVVGTDAIIVTQFSGAGTYTAGLGLSLIGTKFSHADTSSINNLGATSRTYVTGLTFDDFGHVTDYSTGTETVTNTNTTYSVKASTQTGGASLDLDAAGSGSGTDSVTFKGSGATTVTRTDADTITISSVNTTYSSATSTTLGLVKLGSDSVQSVAASAVTATASRSYAVQANSSGQLIVNVPWVDTNTTYAAGNGIGLSGTTFSVAAGTGLNQDTSGLSLAANYGDTLNPYASKTANTFLAAPNGTAGVPTFRAIVAADVPTLNQNTTGSAATLTTTRTLWGQNFNGGAIVTGNLTSVGNITGTGAVTLTATTGTLALAATGANIITASTNGAERMRITSAGNVGIGTTSPTSILQVGTKTSAVSADISTIFTSGAASASGGITTAATFNNTVASANNNEVRITFSPASNYSATGSIGTLIENTTGALSAMRFSTYGAGALTERMRITSAGNVGIGTTSPNHRLEVNGSFAATSKSFLIDHPTKPGQKLQYGSLESPYHGVRLTGEGIISKNSVTIDLPDYIHGLCKQEGAQVQITNIKHGKVIWVEEIDIDNDKFTVALDRGLFDTKEYRFYWSFTAVRKDIEDMIVEINSDL